MGEISQLGGTCPDSSFAFDTSLHFSSSHDLVHPGYNISLHIMPSLSPRVVRRAGSKLGTTMMNPQPRMSRQERGATVKRLHRATVTLKALRYNPRHCIVKRRGTGMNGRDGIERDR